MFWCHFLWSHFILDIFGAIFIFLKVAIFKLRISSLSIFNHPQKNTINRGLSFGHRPPFSIFFRPVLNQLADFAQHTALPQFCLHHVAHLTAMGRAQMYFVSIHLYDYVCLNIYIYMYIIIYIYIYL